MSLLVLGFFWPKVFDLSLAFNRSVIPQTFSLPRRPSAKHRFVWAEGETSPSIHPWTKQNAEDEFISVPTIQVSSKLLLSFRFYSPRFFYDSQSEYINIHVPWDWCKSAWERSIRPEGWSETKLFKQFFLLLENIRFRAVQRCSR